MVRKTRFQHQVDDDTPVTQQNFMELQEQITNLVAAVSALTTQQQQQHANSPRHRRNDQISLHNDSDDEGNPFAPLRRQAPRRRTTIQTTPTRRTVIPRGNLLLSWISRSSKARQ
ncbi:hypothetical protein Bca101_067945 [Brassica carinata]